MKRRILAITFVVMFLITSFFTVWKTEKTSAQTCGGCSCAAICDMICEFDCTGNCGNRGVQCCNAAFANTPGLGHCTEQQVGGGT